MSHRRRLCHVAFRDVQAGSQKRVFGTLAATQPGGQRRSRDVRDAAASAIDQVLSRHTPDGFIVGAHIRRANFREAAIDQHVRNSARLDALEQRE